MLTKPAIIVLIMLLISALTVGCSSDSIASVDKTPITKEQFDRRLEKLMAVYKQNGVNFDTEQGKEMLKAVKKQVLDSIVEEITLINEAERLGISPTEADIQKKVEETIAKFENKESFLKSLESYSMDETGFKEWIQKNLVLDALFSKVTKGIKVSEKDAKEFYDANKGDFKQPEQVRARHILIKFDTAEEKVGRSEAQAKKIALDIIKQLKSGADFAELAKEKTEDPGTKDNGGELTFGKGDTVKEFEESAFALKSGEFTKEPVKTKFGFHIIKQEERTPAKQKTFEEVKDELIQQLISQEKQESFARYTAELKNKANVKVEDKELAEINSASSDANQTMPQGHPSIGGGGGTGAPSSVPGQ